MKKILTLVTTACLAAVGVLTGATLANATDTEPPPAQVVALWQSPDANTLWPQTLVASVTTDNGTPTLDWFGGPPTCGHQYQVDVYHNNEITANLLAGGVLYGPGNPPEALIPGGYDEAYDVFVIECPPEPEVAADPIIETWTEGGCDAGGYTDFTRTTPQRWILDPTGYGMWVATPDPEEAFTGSTFTPLTEDQIEACAGPQPEDVVTIEYGEWMGGEIACDATTVSWNRTVTTTTVTHVRVGIDWIAQEPVTVEEVETQTQDVPANEFWPCTTPPIDEEQPGPSAASAPEQLAATGQEFNPGLLFALFGLLIAGAGTILYPRLRK